MEAQYAGFFLAQPYTAALFQRLIFLATSVQERIVNVVLLPRWLPFRIPSRVSLRVMGTRQVHDVDCLLLQVKSVLVPLVLVVVLMLSQLLLDLLTGFIDD